MDPLLIAAIATALSVGVSIADKFLTSRLSTRVILAVIGLYGFACLALLPLTNSTLPPTTELLIGIGTGVLFAILIFCSFTAIRKEEISRLAPLGVLSTILIIIGSIVFFDEPLTFRKGIAFVFFFGGAFLLSTRFERRLEILDPKTYAHIASVIGEHAWKAAQHPLAHPLRVGKRAVRDMSNFIGDVAHGKLLVVRTRVRVRLVKGLWWFLAAIILAVPYVLIVTWLTKEVGLVPSFVAVRLGLGIGALLIVIPYMHELKHAWRERRTVGVAIIKEPFGIAIGFLLAYAYAHAELGAVRAITSFDAAGIFLLGLLFGRLGIVQESLRKHDIIQKAAGVACMVTGSLVLFT